MSVDFNFGDLQKEDINVNDVQVLDTAIRVVDPKNEKYIETVEDLRRGNPVHTPIYVQKQVDKETGIEYFALVDGAHRLSASKEVGYKTVPAFVIPENVPQEVVLGLQLRLNHLRIKQSPVQEGKQFQRLMAVNPKLTISDLAKLVGYSEAVVRDRLKFTTDNLAPEVLTLVEQGKIPVSNARELANAGKSMQSAEVIQAAQVLQPVDLKKNIDSAKKALSAGQAPKEQKAKEPKVFEPKFKIRDRETIMNEIESGSLAGVKFADPSQQDAFLEGVRWAVSLDEDTITVAREEFERKEANAERLKIEKEAAKHRAKLQELEGSLVTEQESE